jgi:hypothetical protein
MKDCNTQVAGMTGQARKQFMSSCLSGSAQTQGLHCTKGINYLTSPMPLPQQQPTLLLRVCMTAAMLVLDVDS